MELALDPHYVGGKIGMLCVVHTWTGAMIYHPHVHCLVPGGGLSSDASEWLSARKSFLVPVKALSVIFRAKFMELAREALPHVHFPDCFWEKKWVVYSKPTVQGVKKVVDYLARYVHRVAITNRRILSIEDGQIRFRYKDSRDKAWKTMTLPVEEFMRRFLQHVLPRGFHKVRYYGILAPSNIDSFNRAKELLADTQKDNESFTGDEPSATPVPQPRPMLCPSCKIGHLIFIGTVPPKGREPP